MKTPSEKVSKKRFSARAFKMDAGLIVLLIIGSLTSQALGQDVETRGTNEKVSADGGQSRTIYSQRHLSPHRMMHFGKRPVNAMPPTILTPKVYDLYQPERQLQQPLQSRIDKYPYLLSIELDRGQTLQALPEVSAMDDFESDRNLIYNLEHLPQLKLALQNEQVPGSLTGQRFLKLITTEAANESDNYSSNGAGSLVANKGDERPQAGLSDSEQQEDPQQAISVSTRSMHPTRANTLSLPKAYISSLLYGRQGASSLPSFGMYNKKAEPKDNFFMHFGRK